MNAEAAGWTGTFGAGWRRLAASLLEHYEVDPATCPAAVHELGEIFAAETLSIGRNYLEEKRLLRAEDAPDGH